MVAAVSSLAVLGILNTARFETLEAQAKKRSTAATWIARAGVERGVALLLDNPNLRGPLPPIQFPPGNPNTVSVEISQNGQNISVVSTAIMDGVSKTQTVAFTTNQLQQRIASIPR